MSRPRVAKPPGSPAPSARPAGLGLPVRRTGAGASRPSRYGRWRAASLAGVYVLMGLHIAHWKIADKTLAPLELNEVMHTLELGIVTAGFLFMLTAAAATLLFGRFFCGWGCHILALQDLCAWLMRKLRMPARGVRSRLLLIVPAAAMLYMFCWPQITRVASGQPVPVLHVRTDAQGWASFQTTQFWRNLPGPAVSLLTFAVCGFGIVVVLGSRSFCTYVCPYGAIFRGLDRLSPGRIIAAGDCADCGRCTAACPSHVIVHAELQRFGTVVNSACVKDLECVSACPSGVVRYGFGRPPLLRGWRAWWPARRPYDLSRAEDALLAGSLVAGLLVFRGLYDFAPFLLSLAAGAMLGVAVVCLVRLVYRRDVRFAHLWLRQAGRLTWAGAAALCVAPFALAFWGHSAFIRYNEFMGYRAAAAATSHASPVEAVAFEDALGHLETCRRWGLFLPHRLADTLGRLYGLRGEHRGETGHPTGAIADLRRAAELQPRHAPIHYNLGVLLGAIGRDDEAIASYRRALALAPSDVDTMNNLGFLLMRSGELGEAEAWLERALRAAPNHADAHFNLGRILAATARMPEAVEQFDAAARLDPRYAEVRALIGSP